MPRFKAGIYRGHVLSGKLHLFRSPVQHAIPLLSYRFGRYRFGRAYPAGWDERGQGMHCMYKSEWLDADGRVLTTSDLEAREAYMDSVRTHRIPRIATHWAFLLKPLVLDHADEPGAIR